MSICGLASSGFVIAVALSLLISGAVVYYFNRRMANVERDIQQQQTILTEFINNVRSKIETTSSVPDDTLRGRSQDCEPMPLMNPDEDRGECQDERIIVSENETDSESDSSDEDEQREEDQLPWNNLRF